jgi:ribonuclease BN (tRNA processing enzyme)
MCTRKGIRVTVLGARGSAPVFGREFAVFGGSTSCYLVEAGDQSIILDAGSGLINAPSVFARPPVILLSHLHADHLIGLGMYGRISMPMAPTTLYVPARDAREAQRSIARLYSPPLWPLRLTDYPSDLRIEALPQSMRIGEVHVETMEGSHPGGSLCIKLGYEQKTVVYATDFEHGPDAFARLASFAHNADLLLYDAQYEGERYETFRGYGHSTAEKGVELMDRCGAKRLLMIHHDPHSTDEALLSRERGIGRDNVHYARENEVIVL